MTVSKSRSRTAAQRAASRANGRKSTGRRHEKKKLLLRQIAAKKSFSFVSFVPTVSIIAASL
jgi:hypothetical protein